MNLQEVKNKIPHGGYNKICQRAKVHKTTLCNFFNGKKSVSKSTETKILTATAEYLEDLKKQKNNALERLNAIN